MPEGPPKPGESKPTEEKEKPKSPLELARETIEEKERARERKKEARKERWGETKEKAVEKGKIVFEKAGEFSEKAKEFLSNKEIQKQIGKTLIGTTATILGIKSIYDVPVYLRQRFKVRGVFWVGKGLKGSIEDIFSTSQKMHEKIQKKGFKDEQREVRDAIKDLNKRLTLTREGAKKGSEQRKLIAKILWENRIDEKTTKEERGAEIKKILDEYTTTKVTGMQATRESLNTAFVVAGAYGARAVSYGFLDGVERYQRLAKEARGKGERVSILKDVLVKGITETFQEARFKDLGDKEKTKIQRGLSAIGAWGKIARYVGIGATAVWIPGSENELINKALDALSDKDTPGRAPDTKIGDIPKTRIRLPFVEETSTLKDIEALPLFKPSLEYQGGKSIWGEGERQLEERFDAFKALGGDDLKASEALKTYNIDRIKDTVVGDPQKYGLAAGVNVNKLTTEQLKNIKWDGAFKDTFGDKGLTKELSDEQIKGVLKSNQEELKDLRQRLTAAAAEEEAPGVDAAEKAAEAEKAARRRAAKEAAEAWGGGGRKTTEAPGLPLAVAGVGEVLAENPPPKDWSPDIKAEVIEKINANRVKFPNIVTDIQPVPEHESMVIVKFKPNPEAAARWVPEPGGPREVTPVIYSENGPVHILTEENIKTEMADGAKSMPEIAG
ncbi:hypothetical protein IIA95_03460, partial [Patescibacteria group bacterium]|nr:hypothetical protein [Patescibacteria group bacterium]